MSPGALKRMRHDLRTPFLAMQEALALLTDGVSGPISEQQRELLEVVRRNLQRLQGEVAVLLKVLEATKISSRQTTHQPSPRRPRE